jgi:hypothetical protein
MKLAEYQTGCRHTAWRRTKPHSFSLGRDKSEAHTDIQKQTTKIAYSTAGLKLLSTSAVYGPLKSNVS